jgi:hypothetical protein
MIMVDVLERQYGGGTSLIEPQVALEGGVHPHKPPFFLPIILP